MNDIVFKVAGPGEGKTKWLLNIAHTYRSSGRAVYLLSNNDAEYVKFCEKYFRMYSEVCYVQKLTAVSDIKNAVVLVDNLLQHAFCPQDLTHMSSDCYQMFVTIAGSTEFCEQPEERFEQLKITFEEAVSA